MNWLWFAIGWFGRPLFEFLVGCLVVRYRRRPSWQPSGTPLVKHGNIYVLPEADDD